MRLPANVDEMRARAIAALVDQALRDGNGPLPEAYVGVGQRPSAWLGQWSHGLRREAESQRRVAYALRNAALPVPPRLVRAVEAKLAASWDVGRDAGDPDPRG